MVDQGVLDSIGVLPFPINTGFHERLLPPHFKPGNWDVICHNAKHNKSHSKFIERIFVQDYKFIHLTPSKVGNLRLKVCIDNYLRSYAKASSRSGKSAVITDIVESIRDSSDTGGGFVGFDPSQNQWYEVGDKVARDKVGQALRDRLRNRKSIKDAIVKTKEQLDVSELGKESNLPHTPPYTVDTEVQNGCETGALSPTVTVAEHNYSSTPQIRRCSTVTLDSRSDCLRWTWNDSGLQVDHCSTNTGASTCKHANPCMGYFVENVAEWFEHEMAA
eukprot:scaffold5345_cov86-Cylindrotheca_fusiformis.AAC.3